MFGVEGIWLVVFVLGLLALTTFIWYFSRGTDWMEFEIDNDEDSVVQ